MKKRITALFLAAVMLVLFVGCGNDGFDYTKSDLSEYITLNREQYIGQTVEITYPEAVDDAFLDAYVRENILIPNKVNVYLTNRETKKDDIVGLYYRATTEKDGKTIELLTNITSSNEAQYKIGSNSLKFGEAFDAALVGLPMTHTLTKKTTGEIKEGDNLYVTYSYRYAVVGTDGKTSYKSSSQTTPVCWNLSKLKTEATYGEGFVDSLLGKSIGKTHVIKGRFDANNDGIIDEVTFDLAVGFATEEKPATFTVTYPDDAEVSEFKGKAVTFHVFVSGISATAKELLTEKIVTETIGYVVKEEDKGKAVEAYLRDLKKSLEDSRAAAIQTEAVSVLWERLAKEATILNLPQEVLNYYYDVQYEEARTAFDNNKDKIDVQSLDEFLRTYYDMPKDKTYQVYFEEMAKEQAISQLIYYTIVRRENIKVTDEEYKKARPDYIAQMIYSQSLNYYQTYGQYVEFTENDIISAYGEEYIEASVRSSILTQKLEDFLYDNLTVKEKVEEAPSTSK